MQALPIPSLNTIILNTSIRQLTSSLAVKLSVIGDRWHADATRHRWQSFVYHGIVHFININECICVLLQRVTDNMLCISKCCTDICVGICGRIFIYPSLLCFDSYTHPSSVRPSVCLLLSIVRPFVFVFCVVQTLKELSCAMRFPCLLACSSPILPPPDQAIVYRQT